VEERAGIDYLGPVRILVGIVVLNQRKYLTYAGAVNECGAHPMVDQAAEHFDLWFRAAGFADYSGRAQPRSLFRRIGPQKCTGAFQ
jgi:hypothetical protein